MAYFGDELTPIRVTDTPITKKHNKFTELKKTVEFDPIMEEKEEDLSSEEAGKKKKLYSAKKKEIKFAKPKKYLTTVGKISAESLRPATNVNQLNNKEGRRPEMMGEGLENVRKESKSFELESNKNSSLRGWPRSAPEQENELFDRRKVGAVIRDILDKASLTVQENSEQIENIKPFDLEIEELEEKIKEKTKTVKNKKKKKLNMKDVVGAYKALTYGTETEAKTFLENLPYSKSPNKEEKTKSNLKILRKKLQSLEKKGGESESFDNSKNESIDGEDKLKIVKKKKKKVSNTNKIIKIPATIRGSLTPPASALDNVGQRLNNETNSKKKNVEKKKEIDEREPWKYTNLGKSVLDELFILPPPPETKKKSKIIRKRNTAPQNKEKVQINNMSSGKFTSNSTPMFNLHDKLSFNNFLPRVSATSVCNVNFRPAVGFGHVHESQNKTNSCLLYLHDYNAIHVKTPYKNEQFARVKLFRKSSLDAKVPLIQRKTQCPRLRDNLNKLSVQSVKLPDEITLLENQFFKLFDFEEDIENINEFLRSQQEQVRIQEQINRQRRLLGPQMQQQRQGGTWEKIFRRESENSVDKSQTIQAY